MSLENNMIAGISDAEFDRLQDGDPDGEPIDDYLDSKAAEAAAEQAIKFNPMALAWESLDQYFGGGE